jgi:hypothetical protein
MNQPLTVAIVFGFIIALILIRSFFRSRDLQMWHETTRIALEKGQPLPPALQGIGPVFRRGNAWWEFRRGIILLAISVGLYFTPTESGSWNRGWIAVPASLGAAFLLLSLLAALRGDKPAETRDQTKKL